MLPNVFVVPCAIVKEENDQRCSIGTFLKASARMHADRELPRTYADRSSAPRPPLATSSDLRMGRPREPRASGGRSARNPGPLGEEPYSLTGRSVFLRLAA